MLPYTVAKELKTNFFGIGPGHGHVGQQGDGSRNVITKIGQGILCAFADRVETGLQQNYSGM